jgi:hypothetical protein
MTQSLKITQSTFGYEALAAEFSSIRAKHFWIASFNGCDSNLPESIFYVERQLLRTQWCFLRLRSLRRKSPSGACYRPSHSRRTFRQALRRNRSAALENFGIGATAWPGSGATPLFPHWKEHRRRPQFRQVCSWQSSPCYFLTESGAKSFCGRIRVVQGRMDTRHCQSTSSGNHD